MDVQDSDDGTMGKRGSHIVEQPALLRNKGNDYGQKDLNCRSINDNLPDSFKSQASLHDQFGSMGNLHKYSMYPS